MKRAMGVVCIGSFLMFVACGSSSTPSTTTTTATEAETIEVTDLGVLPSLDLDSADVTSASLAVPLSKSVADEESTVGSTSTAGCNAVNFLKPMALAQLKQAEMFKCYVKAVVDNDANDSVTVGDEAFNYYEITGVGDGTEGPQALRVRLGNFTTDSTTTFKMDVGESTDGTTFSRTTEFSITGNTTARTWTGFATTHFTFPEANRPETPIGEPISSAFNNSTFTIEMSSGDDFLTDYNASNATHIETTSTFGRNPSEDDVTDATTYFDGFQVSFEKENTTDFSEGVLNTVSGSFGNADSVSGTMYAQFTKAAGQTGRGAAKFGYSNSMSEDMNFDSSEAFSIGEPEDDGDVDALVVDETGADYSALFTAVDAQDLSAISLTVPTEVNEAVAFDVAWDCTDADGGTSGFTSVSMTGIDVSACDALAQEIADGSGKGGDECFAGGQQQDDQQQGGGQSLVANGSSCSSAAQCQSGICIQSVCMSDLAGTYDKSPQTTCGNVPSTCTITGSGNGPYTCTVTQPAPSDITFTLASATTCTGGWGAMAWDSCTVSGTGGTGTIFSGADSDFCSVVFTKQ